jgi:hypothetical protein
MPSWWYEDVDYYGETDSPAMRYQIGIDGAFREALVGGVPSPDGMRRPSDPVCERCSYVIVDGACVGCAPWSQPSLSERDQRARDVSREGSSPRARTDVAEVNEGELTTSDPNRVSRSESDDVQDAA